MNFPDRSRDWLAQVKNDLLFARNALKDGFFSQCCFITQQAAEKALKSRLVKRGSRLVLTHSLVKRCESLASTARLRQAGGVLDARDTASRSPKATSSNLPGIFSTFGRRKSTRAKKAIAVNKAHLPASAARAAVAHYLVKCGRPRRCQQRRPGL